MHHLLIVTAVLVVALVVLFVAANVLQDVAVARHSLQGEPSDVAEITKPAMKSANHRGG